jgi:hypothetical protein
MTFKMNFFAKFAFTLCLVLSSGQTLGVWFESSGQAVVHKGNKKAAKQLATQEAVKQALLFAGASITSVQNISHGLLEQDHVEIRSSGEVQSVELIDENYHNGIVTVSIRADIFPQADTCRASDYKKAITTTWYPISNRQQAAVGNLYDFGQALANKLVNMSRQQGAHAFIQFIEPYYLQPAASEALAIAKQLTRRTHSQFVLFAHISEFGVETQASSRLKFWASPPQTRNLQLQIKLLDTRTGEIIINETMGFNAPWMFDSHASVNPNSQKLWQSPFGLASSRLLADLNQKMNQAVKCIPAYGRVLHVADEQFTINLGKIHGVSEGDTLTLFQMNQVFDDNNVPHNQFQLHPEKVMVSQIFNETAILKSKSGAPLANIQANDFVARD